MVVLGGVAGAVIGFLVALLITEVIIGNPAKLGGGFDWQLWTDILLTIVGALTGSTLAWRFGRGAKAA